MLAFDKYSLGMATPVTEQMTTTTMTAIQAPLTGLGDVSRDLAQADACILLFPVKWAMN